MSITRRRFFSRSGLLASTALAAPHFNRAAEPGGAQPGQKPKHIIHLVADGMSSGTLSCSDHLSHLLRGRGLTWMQLYNHPGISPALMNVRSLNSLVTDSSASSCAWGSGSRIVNGTVNVLPDGRVLKTLYELFGETGWKRALVTTTEITHATPAGFAASGLRREAAETIAEQYLERKIEVLLGGGRKYFDPKLRKDKRDLRAAYPAQGYAVMETAAELQAAPTDKPWLGLFATSHLPFTLDQATDEKAKATVPTLAVMTRRALDKLQNEAHFIMQVEGGRVDHACHTCDAAAAFHDQIAFDEALDVCVKFQKQHPETLLVITTDHGNGNPALNGTGLEYGLSSPLFANLKKVKRSFGEIIKRFSTSANPGEAAAIKSPEDIMAILLEATGYEMSLGQANFFRPFLEQKGQCLYGAMNSAVAQLGQLLGNHLGIGWTSNSHTSDYVPLLALGPGAERFRGFIQNTDVFKHYLALANIDFKNPEVPLLASCPKPHPGEDLARQAEAEVNHWA